MKKSRDVADAESNTSHSGECLRNSFIWVLEWNVSIFSKVWQVALKKLRSSYNREIELLRNILTEVNSTRKHFDSSEIIAQLI